MEKKYYLRGLGLGIIVTAVIMGIALSGGAARREMTDEEVIVRARELGMTEDTRLLEPAEENQEEETPAEAKEPVKKDVAVKAEAEAQKKDAETAAEAEAQKKDDNAANAAKTEAQEKAAETAAAAGAQKKDENVEAETETKPLTDTPEPKKDTNEMTKQDDDGSMKPVSGGTKSVTIISGDSSYTIAKKLEAAGIVASASSYDTYLCEHGYDKKLRTGTFQIPEGATEEQIAKIVTGQQ